MTTHLLERIGHHLDKIDHHLDKVLEDHYLEKGDHDQGHLAQIGHHQEIVRGGQGHEGETGAGQDHEVQDLEDRDQGLVVKHGDQDLEVHLEDHGQEAHSEGQDPEGEVGGQSQESMAGAVGQGHGTDAAGVQEGGTTFRLGMSKLLR